MYTLELTPAAAAEYLDVQEKRSFPTLREVSEAYLWTSKKPESEYEDDETYFRDVDITTVTREELEGMTLSENQKLVVDAAIYIIDNKESVIVLSDHPITPEGQNSDLPVNTAWRSELLLYLKSADEVNKLTEMLKARSEMIFK